MNFGILHLGQPEKALLEAYRVLRSGSRFAFSVWAAPDETIGFGIVLRAQKPAALNKIREAMRAELETFTKGDFVELPMPALIAAGLKG